MIIKRDVAKKMRHPIFSFSFQNAYIASIMGAKKRGKSTYSDAYSLFCNICRAELGADCVREYRFDPSRRWRFDYAIPAHKIAIEVEGGVWTQGRHTRPAGFIGDMEKYNAAAVLGWRILRTTPSNLFNFFETIKRAVDNSFANENE